MKLIHRVPHPFFCFCLSRFSVGILQLVCTDTAQFNTAVFSQSTGNIISTICPQSRICQYIFGFLFGCPQGSLLLSGLSWPSRRIKHNTENSQKSPSSLQLSYPSATPGIQCVTRGRRGASHQKLVLRDSALQMKSCRCSNFSRIYLKIM